MSFLRRILSNQASFFFIVPALLWQVFFLYAPLCVLLFHSFFTYSPEQESFSFTLQYYRQVFNPLSLKVLFNSFCLAFETTLICFVVGYTVAYFLAFKVKRFRMLYLFLLLLPSWTSLIIQVYAWFFLLKKDGVLSQILCYLHITDQPLHMLNSHFAMLLGLVYCFLPFMALPIYAVLEQIDRQLLEASADLGASRFATFKKIIFPLSLSGVVAGTFLVFIPAFGEFTIPEFLGGSKKLFWGNLIVSKFLDSGDWQVGSAVVYSGVLFPVLVIVLVYFISTVAKKMLAQARESRAKKNGQELR